MQKFCRRCNKTKASEDFYRLRTECKLCSKALNKLQREDAIYLERKRWCRVKKKYGLSKAEWQYRFNEQNGCCAICGVHQSELKKVLVVDHNHETDKVRGLLCNNCNRALGLLKDNYILLQNALDYLAD